MRMHPRFLTPTVVVALLILMVSLSFGWAQQKTAASALTGPKAGLPVLLTSCGQSPGPTNFEIFLKALKLEYVYKLDATAADLAKAPFKSVMIVTGAEYGQAEEALQSADWHVKTALVMLKAGVTKEEAIKRLQQTDGFVRPSIENRPQWNQ